MLAFACLIRISTCTWRPLYNTAYLFLWSRCMCTHCQTKSEIFYWNKHFESEWVNLYELMLKVKKHHKKLRMSCFLKTLIECEVGDGCFPLIATTLKACLPSPVGRQLDYLCFQVLRATPSCCNWAFSNNPGWLCWVFLHSNSFFCLSCILSSLWSCMMKYRGTVSSVETLRQ